MGEDEGRIKNVGAFGFNRCKPQTKRRTYQMAYNALEMQDWQISEEAEKNMPTSEEWREKLGLTKDEVLPMGKLAKLDFMKITASTLKLPPLPLLLWEKEKARHHSALSKVLVPGAKTLAVH